MKKIYLPVLFFSIICTYSLNCLAQQLQVTVTLTPCSCLFAQNGTATATATGGSAPYQYAGDNGIFQTSNVFTGLSGGGHAVGVMDAVGNFASISFIVDEGVPLAANVTTTLTTCYSGFGGTITVNPTNGNGPYSFTLYGYGGNYIETGATQATFTQNIYASTYSIDVSDADGCFSTITAEVMNGDSIHATGYGIAPSCSDAADALMGFQFANGVPPYTLSDPTFTNDPMMGVYSTPPGNGYGDFASGTYTWFIQDSIGCEGMMTVVIPAGLPPLTHAGDDASICAGTSIQLSGSDNGTMMAERFQWTPSTGLSSPDIRNPIASPLVTTTYILTTSNEWSASPPACITSDTITITVINLDVPVVVNNAPVLSVSNPQSGASYTWQQFNGTLWDDIGTGTSYTVTANHDYRVRASNGSCEMFSASQNAGRMANNNPFNIALFPNPTTDMLNLYDLKLEYNWQTLDVMNSQGLRVMPTSSIRNRTSFSANIARLNSGIYIVKLIKADGGIAEIRFIKQ